MDGRYTVATNQIIASLMLSPPIIWMMGDIKKVTTFVPSSDSGQKWQNVLQGRRFRRSFIKIRM